MDVFVVDLGVNRGASSVHGRNVWPQATNPGKPEVENSLHVSSSASPDVSSRAVEINGVVRGRTLPTPSVSGSSSDAVRRALRSFTNTFRRSKKPEVPPRAPINNGSEGVYELSDRIYENITPESVDHSSPVEELENVDAGYYDEVAREEVEDSGVVYDEVATDESDEEMIEDVIYDAVTLDEPDKEMQEDVVYDEIATDELGEEMTEDAIYESLPDELDKDVIYESLSEMNDVEDIYERLPDVDDEDVIYESLSGTNDDEDDEPGVEASESYEEDHLYEELDLDHTQQKSTPSAQSSFEEYRRRPLPPQPSGA